MGPGRLPAVRAKGQRGTTQLPVRPPLVPARSGYPSLGYCCHGIPPYLRASRLFRRQFCQGLPARIGPLPGAAARPFVEVVTAARTEPLAVFAAVDSHRQLQGDGVAHPAGEVDDLGARIDDLDIILLFGCLQEVGADLAALDQDPHFRLEGLSHRCQTAAALPADLESDGPLYGECLQEPLGRLLSAVLISVAVAEVERRSLQGRLEFGPALLEVVQKEVGGTGIGPPAVCSSGSHVPR